MQVNTIFSALAGAERVFAVMDEQPEPEDLPDAVSADQMKGYVQLKNVYFGYNPDTVILKDIRAGCRVQGADPCTGRGDKLGRYQDGEAH